MRKVVRETRYAYAREGVTTTRHWLLFFQVVRPSSSVRVFSSRRFVETSVLLQSVESEHTVHFHQDGLGRSIINP